MDIGLDWIGYWLEQNDVICIWYLLWIYNARETLKETLQQVMQ